jgi:hypothetical protein
LIQEGGQSKWTPSDKLAIFLFCLASIIEFVLFWAEKTPAWAIATLVVISAFLIYLVRLVKSRKSRYFLGIVLLGLIVIFGWKIFPQQRQESSAPKTKLSSLSTAPVHATSSASIPKLFVNRKQALSNKPTTSDLPPLAQVTVLSNRGAIDDAEVDSATIKGSPPPGSHISIVENKEGSKIGKVRIGRAEIDLRDPEPTPPLSALNFPIDSSVNYVERVSRLIEDMDNWNSGNADEFNNAFLDRINIVAAQLRACNYVEVKDLYRRSKFVPEVNLFNLKGLDVSDLNNIKSRLQAENGNPSCADSGNALKQP